MRGIKPFFLLQYQWDLKSLTLLVRKQKYHLTILNMKLAFLFLFKCLPL